MPMVAARLTFGAVHTLLHHRPMTVIGNEETMQVEIETVLDSRAVNLRHESAGARKSRPIDAHTLAECGELGRRAPRVLAAPAADMDSKFLLKGSESPLQGTNDARGDAGR